MLKIGTQVKIIDEAHPLFQRVGRVVSVNPLYNEYRVVVYIDLEMFSDVFSQDAIEVVERPGYL